MPGTFARLVETPFSAVFARGAARVIREFPGGANVARLGTRIGCKVADGAWSARAHEAHLSGTALAEAWFGVLKCWASFATERGGNVYRPRACIRACAARCRAAAPTTPCAYRTIYRTRQRSATVTWLRVTVRPARLAAICGGTQLRATSHMKARARGTACGPCAPIRRDAVRRALLLVAQGRLRRRWASCAAKCRDRVHYAHALFAPTTARGRACAERAPRAHHTVLRARLHVAQLDV